MKMEESDYANKIGIQCMKCQRERRVDLFWDFVILTDDRVFQCLKVAVAAAGIIGNQVRVLNDPVTVFSYATFISIAFLCEKGMGI